MAEQKGPLKEKIDHVQFLTLEQRQRLTKLFDALAKVPDVSGEHVKLEDAFGDWTEALNKVSLLFFSQILQTIAHYLIHLSYQTVCPFLFFQKFLCRCLFLPFW